MNTWAEQARMLDGIGAWVRHLADQRGDHEALVFEGVRYSYRDFNQRINRAASALTGMGVSKGDRVAMLLLNSNAFLEVLFACGKLGAIAVPINFRLSPAEVGFILEDSQAATLIYHPLFSALVEPGRGNGFLKHAVAVAQEGHAAGAGDGDYEQLLAGADASEPDTRVLPDDPLMMMYTSGTTGRPKGALLSHGNATWNCIHAHISDMGVLRSDIVLNVAPLFHIGGLAVNTLTALHIGATVILQSQFDPVEVLKTLQAERVNKLFLVPAMWHALTLVPNFDDFDLSALRALTSGGAPCPIPVIEFFQSRGFTFHEGFGMTETCAGVCILGDADAVRKNGSVGKPLMYEQMRIVDEQDKDVPQGETGELILRGPNIFLEYWNRPDATEEAFRNGWFHTGDLARQDEEGFYYIVDRKKDMLISGGENVYPTEVEQVLYRHPKVQEVAVIGAPDERWGEVPMALVVPRDGGAPTLEELQAFCRDKLARFKTPKHLVVLTELPRTATGKILKRELRKQYGEGGG
ncbi:MAG: o-succinylbenzoate--CoA ligase [Ectothiorhodospiraceae bacterium]|nr:o-succinylbenzoate--CoA ligase [Ectothiorhodospiraceae bacterium]